MTALSKSELVAELVDRGAGDRKHVRNMLDHLADIAQEEILAGEDFTVPGICKLSFRYTKPQTKGSRWKKGDEVVGFGGIATIKDADSPVVKAKVRLLAAPLGSIKAHLPKTRDDAAMRAFLRSKPGKYIADRKG